MMTPHQFESVKDYVDTILVSAFTPMPLDIAAPQAASELVGNTIVDGIANQFRGRLTTLRAGCTTSQWFLNEEWTQSFLTSWIHPVRYGIVVTDRTLLADTWSFTTKDGCQWLVVDWWQWLRKRVPTRRLCDAYMYLCHASPQYFDSPERKTLGIDETVAQSMKEEGSRLLQAIVSSGIESVLRMWSPEK